MHGLKLVFIGLVIGIVAALSLAYLINGILYGVSIIDPVTLGASIFVLVVIAFLACLLPALRATLIDPLRVLAE